jgi:acetyltransferase-like isoleucine patch superfamily enzyme
MNTIAKSAKIYSNVRLGENIIIEDFCIIGVPPHGASEDEYETFIGDNSVIRSHTVIYAGNVIGEKFQTGNKANIRESNSIGNNVSVGTMSVIEHHVEIEDGVRIHSQVFIPEYTYLKKEAWIGPNVVLTNARYPQSPNVKNELRGPIIGENAKVGANSTVLPAVEVGDKALIGAGSVVTKNVEAGAVMAGNPAKKIKDVGELPY